MPRELVVIPMDFMVMLRDLILMPTANLYLPSPHLIIVWDAVICLNFYIILSTLTRGCRGKKQSPPTMHFPLTSIRANVLLNLKSPIDIIHCWDAARGRVMLTLQQLIDERNPSNVVFPWRHTLKRQPTQKSTKSLNPPTTNGS